MPELRLHYTTVGEPSGQPVLVLHGTTGMAKVYAVLGRVAASCAGRGAAGSARKSIAQRGRRY